MLHGIASGLFGFGMDSLRVIVTRREDGLVWVTTADLADVGTRLVLDRAQVRILPEAEGGLLHRDGLVEVGS